MKKLSQKNILHIIALAVLSSILIFHFFYISKYWSIPWYTRLASDLECVYATNTLTIINDLGPVTKVFYPSATNYLIYGTANKIAAFFSNTYWDVTHFNQIDDIAQAIDIMTKANRICRYCSLLIMLSFVTLLYFLFYKLTRSHLLAFLWTLFVATAKLVIIYNYMVRPEILCLFFLFASIYISYLLFEKKVMSMRRLVTTFLLIGLFLGLAMFAKIQIAAMLAIFVVTLIYNLLVTDSKRFGLITQKKVFLLNGLSIANLIVLPWWALKKPEHVTPKFASLWPFNELYGFPPTVESWAPGVLVVLLALLILSVFISLCFKKYQEHPIFAKAYVLALFINCGIGGAILCVYFLCLPIAASLEGYVLNTKTIVYSTFCNIFKGSFIYNKSFGLNNFKEIYAELTQVKFFVFNLFQMLAIGVPVALFRAIKPRSPYRMVYIHALIWILGGLSMDITSTVRESVIYWWYTIYVVCPYSIGLAIILANEVKIFKTTRFAAWTQAVPWGFSVLMVVHLATNVTTNFKETKQDSINSAQKATYVVEMKSCGYNGLTFWDYIDQAMYGSKGFTPYREYGQTAKWGEDMNQVRKLILEQSHLSEEEFNKFKKGDVHKLILKYRITQKVKAYFYSLYLTQEKNALQQGNLDKALESANKAIKVQPNLPEAYNRRALIYNLTEEYGLAVKDLKKASRHGFEIDSQLLAALEDKVKNK